MSGNDKQDSELEARSKAAFDASVSDLDANVRSRLTQARFAAVAELEQKGSSPLRQRLKQLWVPAAGLVATSLIVALVIMPGTKTRSDVALADVDIPLLLEPDNVEMLEDMEFYSWLDDEAFDDGAAPPRS